MVAVLASLLFMYAYGTDDRLDRSFSEENIQGLSKEIIFYAGLTAFGVFNFLMIWGIKVYREARGYDTNSMLFRSENQKAHNLFWLTLFLSSVNILLSLSIAYLGFIKIDGASALNGYLHLPVIGVVLLLVSIGGLTYSVIGRK
jgi:hypothetical protein